MDLVGLSETQLLIRKDLPVFPGWFLFRVKTDKIIMCTAAVYSGYQDLKMRLKVFVVLLLEGLSHFP